MQVLFKTDYDQDINYLVNRGERFRILAAVVLALVAPFMVGAYFLSEISIFLVYILIGAALGRAASKMHGFYMAIATLAFAIVIETAIGAWEPVTGGHMGLSVPPMSAFGWEVSAGRVQYYILLAIVLFCIWGVANLMRSSTGRAFVAVRDSETSARSLGLDIARTRILAFFISASITGLAGGLLAHLTFYLSPESFGVNESLKLLLMVVVGGLGTITGAIFGAVFVSILPNIITLLQGILPQAIAQQAGLDLFLFGAIIAAFIIFEPEGLYGRWRKLRLFLETFPYYKRATFTRQKRYLKTERFR